MRSAHGVPDDLDQVPSLTARAFREGMARILTVLPGRNGVDVDRNMLLTTYWESLQRYEWISDAVWERAVQRLIAQSRWVPPVADVVATCHDVDRELQRAAETEARQEQERAEAVPSWLVSTSPTRAVPAGMTAVIASGLWDRAAAHARVEMRYRREHFARLSKTNYDDALATLTPEQVAARWKRLKAQAEAAARHSLASWLTPEPDDAAIDAELRSMATLRPGEAGCLRGPLEAALGHRLRRGWNAKPDVA